MDGYKQVQMGGVVEGPTIVYEIFTPNRSFHGVRNGITFIDGRAQMAEPRKEDFEVSTDWEKELQACHDILRFFAIELKYRLSRREVTLGDSEPVNVENLLTSVEQPALRLPEEL